MSSDTGAQTLAASVADAPWPPGVRVVLYELLSGTNDYGAEMVRALCKLVPLTVITVDNTKLPAGLPCKLMPLVPAFAKPVPRARKFVSMALAYFHLVKECLRQPGRTVLHIQFLRFERFETFLFGLLQRCGVALVYSAHNALPHDQAPWHAAFYKQWYERVDAVHVLSASVQNTIVQSLGAQPKRFFTAGHGPYSGLKEAHRHLNAQQERRKRGIPESAFVVLQYGLFKTYKGLDTLVDAVCTPPSSFGVFLLLAGAGPVAYLDSIQAQLEGSGASKRHLWYREFVSDAVLCELLAAADLVVFPYRKVSQSGALYLALTFNKAVLCADLPGFREALPHCDLMFFEPGSAPALRSRMLELASDKSALDANMALITEMQKTGGFDWNNIALQMTRMYIDTHQARTAHS